MHNPYHRDRRLQTTYVLPDWRLATNRLRADLALHCLHVERE